MTEKRRIYLDHAATTPVCDEAMEAMLPYFKNQFGNANSLHFFGRQNHAAIEDARRKIAECIGAKPTEIYFTSGGTESDNWALRGMANTKDRHIITSEIEHPAIMTTCEQLAKEGVKITYLPVDSNGIIDPKDLEKVITPDVSLVSVMLANNEVGTLQPIEEMVKIAKKHKVPFHTDAVQAVGSISVDVKELGVDMLSFSAHKFYGPKGIGALYIKGGLKPDRLISGGHQERTMRGGTSNVPLIAGFAAAIEKATKNLNENAAYVKNLRDIFKKEVEKIPFVHYVGDPKKRLPNNAAVAFEFIEGEAMLMTLDLKGIACSSGSACSSASLEPSHVLLAMGMPIELAHCSVRFSFGIENTVDDVNYAVQAIKEAVDKLREMSPLFLNIKGESVNV